MFEKTFYKKLVKTSFDIPLRVKFWDGSVKEYGNGDPQITLIFNRKIPIKSVLTNSSMALGEAYMNGDIDIKGSIEDLIYSAYPKRTSFLDNRKKYVKYLPTFSHSKKASVKDIQHHYDIGNDFYELWLDKTMTYSSAYFEHPDDSLTQAQLNKVDYILRKLDPKPGRTFLDIGCGWGTLMLTAAKKYNLKVAGITLSQEQYDYVEKKIKEDGLQDRAKVELKDYRDIGKNEQYDYVTSIGMFEHVGKKNLGEYFNLVSQYLKPNGRALINGVTRQQGGGTNGWIDKWIFPGGYVPSLTENLNHIIDNGMQIYDLESCRRQYQWTLEAWDHNFKQHLPEIKKMFDEKFIRMWDLYLQSCAGGFKAGNIDDFQYLIFKGPSGYNLPMTRDYMYDHTK
ncbi:MAG: class I SAM-dependent methyltransferase [Acetilactobacillus jinshanensis]